MTTMPAVQPGEPVYHVAELSNRTWRGIRRSIENGPAEHPFFRLQRELSNTIISLD